MGFMTADSTFNVTDFAQNCLLPYLRDPHNASKPGATAAKQYLSAQNVPARVLIHAVLRDLLGTYKAEVAPLQHELRRLKASEPDHAPPEFDLLPNCHHLAAYLVAKVIDWAVEKATPLAGSRFYYLDTNSAAAQGAQFWQNFQLSIIVGQDPEVAFAYYAQWTNALARLGVTANQPTHTAQNTIAPLTILGDKLTVEGLRNRHAAAPEVPLSQLISPFFELRQAIAEARHRSGDGTEEIARVDLSILGL